MATKRYVQHISGQGEKWEIAADSDAYKRWKQWKVIGNCTDRPYNFHYLPKSEYVLCPPSERWVDVTAECEPVSAGDDVVHRGTVVVKERGYRYRKVRVVDWEGKNNESWAFIIEQKVTD